MTHEDADNIGTLKDSVRVLWEDMPGKRMDFLEGKLTSEQAAAARVNNDELYYSEKLVDVLNNDQLKEAIKAGSALKLQLALEIGATPGWLTRPRSNS